VYQRLSRHPHSVNSDFKHYDKSLNTPLMMAGMTVVDGVKKAARGALEGETEVLRAIATDTAAPYVIVGKELINLAGALASGVYITFFLNCMCNSILNRLAFIHCYPDHDQTLEFILEEFEKHVVFFALGDDNMLTVSDEAIAYFNFTTIQAFYKTIGMVYTNADKTNAAYISVPVTEATIGKRAFRFCPEYNYYFCPIEKATIGKILCVVLDSGPLTMNQKMLACIDAVVPEFAQYGRAEYDLCIDRMKSVLAETELTYKFPTYESQVKSQIHKGITPWASSATEEPVLDGLSPLGSFHSA